jgi:hypothetical protein
MVDSKDLNVSDQSNPDPSEHGDEPAFADRILQELQETGDMYGSPRDRLPPLWQVFGAIVLLIALVSVVVALGAPDSQWHERFLTGFLDGVLVFLGSLGNGIRNLWDVIMPGKGYAVLGWFTAGVSLVNAGICLLSIRRQRQGS